MDVAGNLYGTTSQGGTVNSNCFFGCGTDYELSPASGGGWSFSTIYNFQGGSDGATPNGGFNFRHGGQLVQHGNIGGTLGGQYGWGPIYELAIS